jgi:hypothetical protein
MKFPSDVSIVCLMWDRSLWNGCVKRNNIISLTCRLRTDSHWVQNICGSNFIVSLSPRGFGLKSDSYPNFVQGLHNSTCFSCRLPKSPRTLSFAFQAVESSPVLCMLHLSRLLCKLLYLLYIMFSMTAAMLIVTEFQPNKRCLILLSHTN